MANPFRWLEIKISVFPIQSNKQTCLMLVLEVWHSTYGRIYLIVWVVKQSQGRHFISQMSLCINLESTEPDGTLGSHDWRQSRLCMFAWLLMTLGELCPSQQFLHVTEKNAYDLLRALFTNSCWYNTYIITLALIKVVVTVWSDLWSR